MQSILTWLQTNWWWVLIAVAALAKILNKVTQHFSEYKGLVRWCLFLVDLLDVIKSTPPPEGKVIR